MGWHWQAHDACGVQRPCVVLLRGAPADCLWAWLAGCQGARTPAVRAALIRKLGKRPQLVLVCTYGSGVLYAGEQGVVGLAGSRVHHPQEDPGWMTLAGSLVDYTFAKDHPGKHHANSWSGSTCQLLAHYNYVNSSSVAAGTTIKGPCGKHWSLAWPNRRAALERLTQALHPLNERVDAVQCTAALFRPQTGAL